MTLFKHQFGFRPGHSTSHALINFVNKVANAVDCQKYLAGIFLDLSKAFHTLDHAILLSKLEACNITGTAHQWITDYFRDRIQYVQWFKTNLCYFIKLNTICPQNLFLHYTMPLFIHILLTAI